MCGAQRALRARAGDLPLSSHAHPHTRTLANHTQKNTLLHTLFQFNILSCAGVDKLSRPVVVFSAMNLPPREYIDHELLLRSHTHTHTHTNKHRHTHTNTHTCTFTLTQTLLHTHTHTHSLTQTHTHTCRYLKRTLDRLVESDYSILYFHYGLKSDNKPSLSFLRKIYSTFDRKYKKNLKNLYIVHPTSFVRTILGLMSPLLSSKFGRKIAFVSEICELKPFFHVEQLDVPQKVRE